MTFHFPWWCATTLQLRSHLHLSLNYHGMQASLFTLLNVLIPEVPLLALLENECRYSLYIFENLVFELNAVDALYPLCCCNIDISPLWGK